MEVTIKTRWNIGDTAYRFNESTMKLEEFTIKSICASLSPEGDHFINYFSETGDAPEYKLFASKEEFINNL